MPAPEVMTSEGAGLGHLHGIEKQPQVSVAAGAGNLAARAAVPEALLALAEGLAEVPVQVGVALQVLREDLSSCYFGELGVDKLEFRVSWRSI